ncbi:MAG: DUF554 domain-containing protein [Acidimicrobiia bacterium]|nr:DUF554 domain-containing protein [Acidimicrobiia bacterium]NNF11089.1 DUF554 domain-containing protein [Acidimicrobiia bacterium]NNL69037.1 DUF554 domain-containing protein [Acidimicrobiia bacterium]
MFLGTAANVATVLIGSAIGGVAGARFPERIRSTVMAGLGLLTLAIGFRDSLEAAEIIPVLAAILVGGVIGELIRIEQGLERLGDWLRDRFAGQHQTPHIDPELPEAAAADLPAADGRARFAEGFVVSSLVFCVGPLTVLGSINDGLGDPELLYIKAGLDGFASIAFAAVYGWGVILSAATVLVVQGGIAVVSAVVGDFLSDASLAALASAGGILLLGVALRLLDIKRIRVGNLLPALLLAPLFTAL